MQRLHHAFFEILSERGTRLQLDRVAKVAVDYQLVIKRWQQLLDLHIIDQLAVTKHVEALAAYGALHRPGALELRLLVDSKADEACLWQRATLVNAPGVLCPVDEYT